MSRLTTEIIKERLEKYGWIIDTSNYKNRNTPLKVYDVQIGKNYTISYNQMIYRINRGYRSEYDFYNILLGNSQSQQQHKMTSFERFCRRMQNIQEFNNATDQQKNSMFKVFIKLISRLRKISKQHKYINIDFTHKHLNKRQILCVLLEVLNTIAENNQHIRITTTNDDGISNNYTLNQDTIQYFMDYLNQESPQEMQDSTSDVFDNVDNWNMFRITFTDFNRNGGFFQYLNKTGLDLSYYDIFKTIDQNNYIDNCFVHALINSNKFTTAEINVVKSCVNTRLIRVEDIKELTKLLNTCFTIRFDGGFKRFGAEYKNNREVILQLFDNHFAANKQLNVSQYYLQHYQELDSKYPNDDTRFTIINDNNDKKKSPITIIRLVKLMKEYNCLEFIDFGIQKRLAKIYKRFKQNDSTLFKSINIPTKSHKIFKNNDGYQLFGTHLEPNQLQIYYNKLQAVINNLGLNIDVRNYKTYPGLMEKIMYDYGCFDGVNYIIGDAANRIRDQLVFPRPHTADNKPFYSNKKLYYIDLNGAYLSCIDSIPTGDCNDNLEFSGENTKIKELMHKMYRIRKESNDNIMIKCLKLLQTCCWGLSIKRNKRYKSKNANNKFINENQDYIIEISDDLVKYIQSVNVHYSYPQFARQVLNNFHNKIAEVCSKIKHVYYFNIDAILIDEEDYNTLCSLGYVGDQLGQFKIEHIFTEIAIASQRKYVAKLDNGEQFYHSVKSDYDEFVYNLRSSPTTTVLI